MRLIGMSKNGDRAKIDFFGCPLSCDYCTHLDREKIEYDVMDVLEFVADPSVEEVYLGGAEPTLQQEGVLEILNRLQRMEKKAILKTSGYDPDFIEQTIGLVHKYIVEVKCPIDSLKCNSDLAGLSEKRTEIYLKRLEKTIEILKGQKVRVWIRVIPGFIDQEIMETIGEQISGTATEAMLYQFLSNPDNDAPFAGFDKPVPQESEMVSLGRVLVNYVPRVIIQGDGFYNEFKQASQSD